MNEFFLVILSERFRHYLRVDVEGGKATCQILQSKGVQHSKRSFENDFLLCVALFTLSSMGGSSEKGLNPRCFMLMIFVVNLRLWETCS